MDNWSEWSDPSTTCGGATQMRRRKILMKEQHGGKCPFKTSEVRNFKNKNGLPCFKILSCSQFGNPLPNIPLIEITYPKDGSKDNITLGKHELSNNVFGDR